MFDSLTAIYHSHVSAYFVDHMLLVRHVLKNLILNDVQDNIFWYAKCILHIGLGVLLIDLIHTVYLVISQEI